MNDIFLSTFSGAKSVIESPDQFILSVCTESKKLFIQKCGKYSARFSREECTKCERKEICQPEKGGKRVTIRFEIDILKNRRELMTTDEFKKDMHQRNGIEGTISGLVRGQGMRRSRYFK